MDSNKLGDETVNSVEEQFKNYCKTNNVKYKSKEYYKLQHSFFIGAITVFTTYIGNDFVVPPKWGISLMSEREIIEKY